MVCRAPSIHMTKARRNSRLSCIRPVLTEQVKHALDDGGDDADEAHSDGAEADEAAAFPRRKGKQEADGTEKNGPDGEQEAEGGTLEETRDGAEHGQQRRNGE